MLHYGSVDATFSGFVRMIDAEVRADSRDGVTTIWLNRPERKNAINMAGWIEIQAQIALADVDPKCRVIIIRGAAGNFGAGADISEFAQVFATPARTLEYFASMEAAMQSIEHSPKPVIAAIEGLCFGACVALSLACDVRIVSDRSVFAITPAKLGIVDPYGDVRRVLNAIGPGRAKSLLFSGRQIDAVEARIFGLVDHLVDHSDYSSELGKLVQSTVNASLWTTNATKVAVRDLLNGKQPDAAGYPEMLARTVAGIDFVEGTAAFLEKRRPEFSFSISADDAL
jgi:enoyl-CoA hydratase/carnithine racemase